MDHENDASTEDQLRLVLAYLKAVADGDREAVDVLTASADLEELAAGLADIALLFIEVISADPSRHLDRMFRAVTLGGQGPR